jgi:Fe-S cluster biogenesis protein NfuA
MKDRVLRALESVRPGLQADGGDVELIEVNEQGRVLVKLTGNCGDCPMSKITLQQGIERILKTQVPEVSAVEAVDN